MPRLFTLPKCLILILVALAVVHSPFARAESDKTEALIRQAVELRRAGDDQKAYPLFREAYQTSHSPRSAGQLGLCEQALGSWVDAETHLGESLRAPSDQWIKKNRMTIEQALTLIKSHIARVEVTGEPAGAKVLINGNSVGQLPLSDAIRIAAGQIEIELRAPGFARVTRSVRVEGGQYHKIYLSAEKEAVAATSVPGPVVAATSPMMGSSPVDAVPGAASGSPAPSPTPALVSREGTPNASADAGTGSSGSLRSSLKFVSWGLAAGALGVGVYGVLHNRTLVQTFDSGCGIDPMGMPRANQPSTTPGFSDSRCADLKHSYESASVLGIVGLASGAALAGLGVVLWLTEPSPTRGQTALVSCAPALTNGAGPFVGCVGQF